MSLGQRVGLSVAGMCFLLSAVPLAAQVTPIGYQARVTLRDSTKKPIHGLVIASSTDWLTIQMSEGGARIALDKREIQRVDRHRRRWSSRSFGLAGCAIGGGAGLVIGLNILGSKTPSGVAMGCAIVGFAGVLMASVGPVVWEEVSL